MNISLGIDLWIESLLLSTIRISEPVWIIRGVVVPIEVPPVVRIRRHRINAQEPPDAGIVIALNKATHRDFPAPTVRSLDAARLSEGKNG